MITTSNIDVPYQWDRYSSLFEKSFLKNIGRNVKVILPLQLALPLPRAIFREAEHIYWANLRLVTDAPSQNNYLMAVYVLAAYKVLQPLITDNERLINMLAYTFKQTGSTRVKWAMRVGLWFNRNKMKFLVQETKRRALRTYGKSFTVVTAGDCETFFASIVQRCGYYDFFTANGASEITRVMCAWDHNWIDEIKPDKHMVKFSRPVTIAAGGEACEFQFYNLAEPLNESG